jgi:predicted secreted Zn-dependent protease
MIRAKSSGRLAAPLIAGLLLTTVQIGARSARYQPGRQQSPDVSVKQFHYEIVGATVSELRGQMHRLGPMNKWGRHCDAYTDWYVSWAFRRSQSGDGCRSTDVKLKLDVKQTLPKWKIPSAPDEGLVDRWNAFIKALQAHEDGHKEFGLRAASEILQKISALPVSANCEEMVRAANKAGDDVLDKYRKVEIAYDRETNHGETQGARLR